VESLKKDEKINALSGMDATDAEGRNGSVKYSNR